MCNMLKKILCCLFLFVATVENVCEPYSACKPTKVDSLNIHIVPHSHDDVGWLKTVEQYYYGANNSIQNAGVQYIYDSVVDELWRDPEKTFVSVEMEFFFKWWRDQNTKIKEKVMNLVERGQLEFVGGGWCMNDEAASSYVDIIDQMTLGLNFLNATFGSCGIPKAVWQVDPFGHSREQASIFAQMGFEYLFLGRIDHQDKSFRLSWKEMEMMWRVSNSLDIKLFTGVLYNNYGPPPGFCFDIMCNDEPLVDDPENPMYNIDRRAKDFVTYALEQSKHYVTNNIMITMGEDFHYQYAHTWFKNLDKLIKYVNSKYKSKIQMIYSSPSCYGHAVRNALQSQGTELPLKWDDFFPYSSDPHAYWTGYFTSRPAFKGLVRKSSNLLQACKQLEAASARFPRKPSEKLFQFQRNQAIAQHHDAVTGTAKQHVSDDYVQRLDQSMRAGFDILSDSYNQILPRQPGAQYYVKQEYCLLLNVSQCDVTETNPSFVLTMYNPLSYPVSHTVRIPVTNSSYTVTDFGSEETTSQLIAIPDVVLNLPGRQSDSKYELIFQAVDLPPLGIRSYHISADPDNQLSLSSRRVVSLPAPEDVVVSNKDVTLKFDRHTGLLTKISNQTATFPVVQEILYYQGMAGNNSKFEFRASGAYIFRPNGTALPIGSVTQLVIVEGPVVIEVYQEHGQWASQTFRLHPGQQFIEVNWVIGPIPVEDGIGKEIVLRFTADDIRTNGTFYTDSNGKEMIEREVNHQSTYQVNVTEPEAGNFYPVTFAAYVEDLSSRKRMVVMNDRAQGVSSLQDGALEFMVHRRLLHDDAFGVGEPLNETAFGTGLVVRGSHWLLLSESANWRPLAVQKAHPPILSFVPTKLTSEGWSNIYRTEVSLVNHSLPTNVKLLTLEPWDDQRILVRFEHLYGIQEDEINSRPVVISLKDLFSAFEVISVERTNLAANDENIYDPVEGMEFTLLPMEIQTFLLRIQYRDPKSKVTK